MRDLGSPKYGIVRHLPHVPYAAAVEAVRLALAAEGFGILTEIDVAATLKKKLDVDHAPYIILGACNPPLAHKALTAEAAIGLLLPCNVVVADDEQGGSSVAALDPHEMFKLVDKPGIAAVADDARERLQRALDSL